MPAEVNVWSDINMGKVSALMALDPNVTTKVVNWYLVQEGAHRLLMCPKQSGEYRFCSNDCLTK